MVIWAMINRKYTKITCTNKPDDEKKTELTVSLSKEILVNRP